jgi:trigger factor
MSEIDDQISVEVKDEGPCRKTFAILIPSSKVDAEYKQTLKAYQGAVRIPGFRPGKAPVPLVQNHYKKQIQEELQDRLIPLGYQTALKESGLDVVSVLNVSDVEFKKGQPISVRVLVDVAPDFDLPNYKGIDVSGEPVEITDEKVEDAFQEFLNYYGTYEDVSGRPVKETDLVQVDYKATLDGTPLGEVDAEAENLTEREDFWVRAGEDAFLAGFGTGLIGLSAEDSKDIEVTFDEKFVAKNLAGKTALFATKVKAIREKIPPELNAELFEKLQVESEEEIRDKIRTDLEQAAEEKESNRRREVVIAQLLGSTEMNLPSSEVSQETQSVIQDIVRHNTSQGVTEDEIKENKEEIFETASRNAQQTVKLNYILHKISEAEKVDVTDQEFDAHIAGMAASYRMEPEELMGQLKHRNAVDRLRSELRHRKTMDFVMEQTSLST